MSDETNKEFIANQSGEYAVIVTQNNCMDTSFCQTVTVTGLFDYEDDQIIVYQNPTHSQIHIKLPRGHNFRKIRLFDLAGNLLYYHDIPKLSTDLNIQSLLSKRGLYIIELEGRVTKHFKLLYD